MTKPLVTVDRSGPVVTITINRPEKRNAVDRPTATALREAFSAFEKNDELKVAVLTGSGGNFCAGADLSAMGDETLRNEIEPSSKGPMGPSRIMFSKPVIAAVSGYAVAGGLELALMCDMRVADTSAVFGVFCRRWGVPLIDGGTARLPRIVGQGHAMDMILTGRPVDAEEARSMGLANRVAAAGEALAAAQDLAAEIAAFPQQCLRADRASAYRQWDVSLSQALVNEGEGGYPIVFAEALEGAGRFAAGAGRHGSFSD